MNIGIRFDAGEPNGRLMKWLDPVHDAMTGQTWKRGCQSGADGQFPYHRRNLRKVLLRAVEDRTFAADFRDGKAIESFVPLPASTKTKKAASGPIT
jgi:hypothetical protein